MLSTVGIAAACGRRPPSERWPFRMGDAIRCGWFSFNVLEVAYKGQLGEGPLAKAAKRGFLTIRLQATSSAGQTVSMPFLQLETLDGQLTMEIDDASALSDWLGVLRRVEPGATETGWLVFDVSPGTYGLRLSDGVLENEQTALVRVPFQVDASITP